MTRFVATLLAAIVVAGAIAACGGTEDPAGPGGEAEESAGSGFDGDRAFADLEAQVALGPRPSGSPAAKRAAALIAQRLSDAGVEDVTTQWPWANVVGTIPGSEPGTIVVGAHYDTKDAIPGFVGANDGGSGVAVVLELARALPNPAPGPSIALALFDAEEARGNRDFEADGTRGSRQYVALARRGAQGSPQLGEIEAMVLFDMVGDCDLQIPLEASSNPDLYARFADAANELNGSPAPFEGRSGAVSDDHDPFLRTGIPAVDLIDFDYGPGPTPGQYWHTPADTLDHVCPESLAAVGEPALKAIEGLR